MYFFTSDEHFFHMNIIKYCSRPFGSIGEMHDTIINNHNEVVGKKDIVIHAGDFSWNKNKTIEIIKRLNGQHIFLQGSHDKWTKDKLLQIWEKTIDGQHIVVSHYAMRVWPKSHYGSWQLYGHSHGKLPALNNQLDIGVDTNDFYPYSFENIKSIFSYLNRE